MAVTTIGQLIESIRLLCLVLVLVPLRRGELWAWCTCWVLLIAYVGYTVTTAQDGSTSFAYSLVADVGLPMLLVVQLSRFGRREDPTLLNVRKLTVGQPRREVDLPTLQRRAVQPSLSATTFGREVQT